LRKLMWFAVGFTATCALGAYVFGLIWSLIAAAVCLVCAICVLVIPKIRKYIVLWILLGTTFGFLWFGGFSWIYLQPAQNYDAERVEAQITVTDYSIPTDYGIRVDGKIELDGKTYKIRCYRYSSDSLCPGDVVWGEVKLKYTVQDDFSYHPGKGIFLIGYIQEGATVVSESTDSILYYPARLRRSITQIVDRVFPADTVAFARALLLGDGSLLTYAQNTDFSLSGIRHVIAVSGLHVSILFSLVYVLSGKNRFITALLGIPVLFLFCAVAGFTPSVVRACIMQGLMILSLLLYKEYDPPTALATAVLVMLLVNPMAITSVSLQLSAGCMVGIFLFSSKIQQFFLNKWKTPKKKTGVFNRLRSFLISSVSVTLGAMTTTTALCAGYFGTVSLIGILTNLLTLWVISFVFYGIMVACILGAIWLPLGQGVAWLISWVIRYILLVAKLAASVSYGCLYTESIYVVIWLLMCYVLLAVFLLWKKKRPAVLSACMAVALVFALLLSWLEPKLDSYRMSVLDVGQGQCILLQQDSKTYMVDCGGSYAEDAADLAAATLLSQGVFKLDGLILTHYDQDHAAGAELLLQRIPAETIYAPDIPDAGGIRDRLEESWPEQMVYLSAEQIYSISDMNITLFAAKDDLSDNESCVCVLFQPENCDILITGDRTSKGEKALLEQTQLPKLEVLVAGHHGSHTSTSFELLAATSPQMVVISAGEDNQYGHPSQQLLDRLELFACQVLRTDLQGTIVIRG